jgi:predicted lipase
MSIFSSSHLTRHSFEEFHQMWKFTTGLPVNKPGMLLQSPLVLRMPTMTMHASTAPAILSAVQNTLSTRNLSSVTVVGHSLGAALALLDGVFFSLQLPENVTVKVTSYGMPRVGNQAFADFVDSQLSGRVTHVNNQEDPVPVVPGEFLGFHHPSGEIHILDSGAWDACSGACVSSSFVS